MVFKFHERVGMIMLSVAAPKRLARLLLRANPQPLNEPLETSGQAERILFPTQGGLSCRGWWIKPAGQSLSDHVVILAHGWTSHALRLKSFIEPLLETGYQVMLYHSRSHGDSDAYIFSSIAQFTEDVVAAVQYATGQVSHIALVGHSLGAAASLVATADGAPIEAVVALAPFAHPRRASTELLISERMPGHMIMNRIAGYVEGYLARRFDTLAPEFRLPALGRPVLLVHGTDDDVIPFSHFEVLQRVAGPHVETLVLQGGNHDSVKTEPIVLDTAVAFLRRVFPPTPSIVIDEIRPS
jgi:alpha-beta hydrolase superfamily lysophospholipase